MNTAFHEQELYVASWKVFCTLEPAEGRSLQLRPTKAFPRERTFYLILAGRQDFGVGLLSTYLEAADSRDGLHCPLTAYNRNANTAPPVCQTWLNCLMYICAFPQPPRVVSRFLHKTSAGSLTRRISLKLKYARYRSAQSSSSPAVRGPSCPSTADHSWATRS